jgi:hypothetical protein
MRRFMPFLLVSSFLAIPAVAQRGGSGFHGGMGGGFRGGIGGFRGEGLVGPGFRGDGLRGFRGAFFPGKGFIPFGFPGDWPGYYSAGLDSPDYGYADPDFGYLNNEPAYTNPYYAYGYTPSIPVVEQSPPKVTEYRGPAATCPQADGKPFYRIAVPADNRERKIPPTYQNNIWIVRDYSSSVGTLSFATIEGEQKKTPINSVDRALTLQLNRACDVNFQFPQ